MGRYATPLITAPPLPPVENGVEVLICEARLAHRATDNPEDVEEEQLMTVLLSFDPSPGQRYAARNLAGTFIAAQSIFEQLPIRRGLAEWLLGLLNSRISASMNIVLSLPPAYSEDIARQIEAVLARLRNDRHHQLGLTVAVCVSPAGWADCSGIDGFVSAAVVDDGRASLHVFSMLAALMAPGLSSCVDCEDLRSVFGTHEFPSSVVSGVWLEGQDTFVWASSEDQKLVKKSKTIASMPSSCLRLASQQKLMREICKSNADDFAVVMVAPYDMSPEPLLGNQIVAVSVIAAPGSELSRVPEHQAQEVFAEDKFLKAKASLPSAVLMS